MSRQALRVTASHLRELAAQHGRAAAESTSATEAVAGVDSAIRTSHGVIAGSTAAAVEAVQQARRDAGESVAGESGVLSEHLILAAGRYEATDGAAGDSLDQQIRPGPTTSPPRLPR